MNYSIKFRLMKCNHVCLFKRPAYSAQGIFDVQSSYMTCIICRIKNGQFITRQGKRLGACEICKWRRKKMLAKEAYARRKFNADLAKANG